MPETYTSFAEDRTADETNLAKRSRKFPRIMMVARRMHLYAGLFLLPWVFLYGVTGAMYNHEGLFPDVESEPVPVSIVAGSSMSQFPTANELAVQVAQAIDAAAADVTVEVAENAGAKFTNNVMFMANTDGRRSVLHINPHSQQSHLVRLPEQNHQPTNLLPHIHNLKLDPDPQALALQSAQQILSELGNASVSDLRAHGFTKLNFLASVNGEIARVTYVLKDGHVDVTKFDGNPGMSPRAFMMRLHTTHGQSPTWTGRMIWSLFVDTMAIAMVSWGFTGLLMWWQIKRVRVVGGIVMTASIAVAITMFFVMKNFYATNML